MTASASAQTPRAAATAQRSAAAPAPSQPRPQARAQAFDDHSDVLRLDLSDVPYMSPGLHVEALQPTWLSRIAGLFLKTR
jgi:hypothetical protein